MAIDTTNEKLGVMEWCSIWEPGLPISPGTLGQDDKQQLLWGFPGVLWAEPSADTSGTRRQRQIKSLTRVSRIRKGRRR